MRGGLKHYRRMTITSLRGNVATIFAPYKSVVLYLQKRVQVYVQRMSQSLSSLATLLVHPLI